MFPGKCEIRCVISAVEVIKKTSMMWPSQNSYNGTVIKIKVKEWINN